jgi:hypothetical protein
VLHANYYICKKKWSKVLFYGHLWKSIKVKTIFFLLTLPTIKVMKRRSVKVMKKAYAVVAFCTIAFAATAQTKFVNEFLNIGVGARSFGMGGAVAASAKDVTAGYWNPAGLRDLPSDFQVSMMHNEYFGGLAKYDYVGVAYKIAKNKGNLGVNVIRFGIDDIPNTLSLQKPDGTLDFSTVKSFSAVDYAAIICYSRDLRIARFADRDDFKFTIGGNAKIINRSIGSFANAWGVGVDLGIRVIAHRWMGGLVLRDATTTYTGWNFTLTEKEKTTFQLTNNIIPAQSGEVMNPRLILAVARQQPINDYWKVLGEMDWDFTTDGKRYGNVANFGKFSGTPRFGVEGAYRNQLFARVGVNGFQKVLDNTDTTFTRTRTLYQPSIGFGIYNSNVTIDYAFTSLNLQKNPLYSHVISLKLDVRKPRKFRKDANKENKD